MSLLNDMLRDLSRTPKNPDETNPDQGPLESDDNDNLFHQSSMAKREPKNWWPSLIVFMSVLVLLLLWRQNNFNSADIQPNEDTPKNLVSAAENAVAESSDDKIKETVSEDSIVSSTSSQAEEKTPDEILTERLAALEMAITSLSVAVQSAQLGDARKEQIPQEQSENQEVSLDKQTAYQESVSIRDPFAPSETVPKNSQPKTTAAEEAIPADAHLAIAPNAAFLDQRQADVARALYAEGYTDDAITELQKFIARAEVSRESTLALLDIFNSEANSLAMKNLLGHATSLGAVDQQFYQAKIAVIEQREDEAVELLEVYLNEADQHEGYRALLAGLYQRTGKYDQAATAYHRLLTNFGEKPAYWLGFALAQDSLNQTQTARQAYLRLANYSGLQPEVRSYIQQRLASLQ